MGKFVRRETSLREDLCADHPLGMPLPPSPVPAVFFSLTLEVKHFCSERVGKGRRNRRRRAREKTSPPFTFAEVEPAHATHYPWRTLRCASVSKVVCPARILMACLLSTVAALPEPARNYPWLAHRNALRGSQHYVGGSAKDDPRAVMVTLSRVTSQQLYTMCVEAKPAQLGYHNQLPFFDSPGLDWSPLAWRFDSDIVNMR